MLVARHKRLFKMLPLNIIPARERVCIEIVVCMFIHALHTFSILAAKRKMVI